MNKKQKQLGINPSTANGRLLKDILFNFVVESKHVCFRCKLPLTRDTFSIEHIIPWLDSENPVELFFDINNIAYSHLVCNTGAARKIYTTADHGTRKKYKSGCRCESCREANALAQKEDYTVEKRRIKYAREKLRKLNK